MLDTGIYPNSPSFSDDGFGPPPSKWKVRSLELAAYREGSTEGLSPLDDEGHGSHTGVHRGRPSCQQRQLDGLAAGVARGAVPGARLAIYKVCWNESGCLEVDMLAAFDDAIADGVDVNLLLHRELGAVSQSCGYHRKNRDDGQSTSSGSRLVLFSGAKHDHPRDLEVTPMNTPGNSNTTAFKYGAGQLNPVKANNPGLVYDASESDYVAMLCAQGYNATQLALITGSNTTVCPNGSMSGSPSDLNYPTMAARVEPGKNFTVSFPRTATNVGAASEAYDVKVIIPIEAAKDILIDVSPSKLEFSAENQKISFTVTVSGVPPLDGQVHSAAIVWYNNEHEVRSPVVVYTEVDW
ncbi:hypothetical protein HU200_046415 [Digitaria exilis]|uniref:Subtilisin-like protease fibronectin type-III domain-containing protein n=1 Tax=Digitaria exilis TaxID=1010633 RepID=A0A835B5R4_9POAL|nr:hypothetical protein HU200_046415 [Digitaria exilis]